MHNHVRLLAIAGLLVKELPPKRRPLSQRNPAATPEGCLSAYSWLVDRNLYGGIPYQNILRLRFIAT